MRIRTNLVRLGLPVLLLAGGSGCLALVAGAAGGATAAYVTGDLEAELTAAPQRVVSAAVKVLEGMEMRGIQSSATSLDGKVEAKTALDKKVTITVKSKSETTSTISIRVDTFGDAEMSQQILDKIKARL